MPFPSTLRHALPWTALLLLALWGPGAKASLLCTPLVGDVTAGATQRFRVTNAQEQVCRGTWSIGAVNALGAWVAEGADRLGTFIDVADGVMDYRAPELANPARALLRFTPEDAQEAPIQVPVRLWLQRAATNQATAAASSPTSPARPNEGGAPGPDEVAPSPEGRKRKSFPPATSKRASKLSRYHPPAGATAEQAMEAVEEKEEKEEKEGVAPATPGPAPSGSASSPLEVEPVPAAVLEDEARPASPGSAGGAASAHAASALPSPPLAVAGGQPAGRDRFRLRQNSLITKHHKMIVALTLEKTLGTGSSASVFEVDIESPSRPGIPSVAAAKVWERQGATPLTKAQLAKMKHEVMRLQQLGSHPHVIKFLGFNSSEKHFFITTELAETNLAKLIAKAKDPDGRLPEHLIRRYARQILMGLHHIHSCGLVHRDLKGQNILLSNNQIKIADFGSAQSCPDGMKIGLPDGLEGCTPAWAAPELLDRRQGYDRKADIWSFACVLLEMLTGNAPWHDQGIRTLDALVQELALGSALPAIPAHASPELGELIARCLKRDPEQRPDPGDLLNDAYFVEVTAGGAATQAP